MNAKYAPRFVRLIAALTLAFLPLVGLAADPAPNPNTAPKTDPKTDPAKKTDAPKEEPKKDPPKKEEPKLPTPSPSSKDWKLEVLKEKPNIYVPSVVAAAPDCRIFVAEDPMHQNRPGNKPADRILCFHPDGKMTIFADK